ncbi:uncharacterized protein LOC113204650 [Frankliniella occidentalis]|uniref:Uncharacterized protein LOC113204650 n=1 Tax=Frankliniella occidentalis TaxID=133901 RepID=A0A6J1S8V6_FRAOC|nr:uncharacterized protein LOC113204650 [Frankliniella occidentalis]
MLFALTAVTLALVARQGATRKAFNTVAGPYIAYAERLYMCEPPDRPYPWRWHFTPSQFNPQRPQELQRLTGNMTGDNIHIDDSCTLKVNVDAWSNSLNRYKVDFVVIDFKDKACQKIRMLIPGFCATVYKSKEIKRVCDFEPGLYEVNNRTVDWTVPNIPIFPYGRYKMRLSSEKAGETIFCLGVDFRTIPNPVHR